MSIPNHLAIIIDGNRRWAKEKGLSSFLGHKKGYDNVEKIGEYCKKKGVKIMTFYAFSTENWKRSKTEVSYLMRLLGTALNKKNIDKFNKDKVRVKIIGQKERLPKILQKKVKEIEEATKDNKEFFLNLAISYGGRLEIVQAIKEIIKKKIPLNKIDEELVNKHLWTEGMPYPDLIIRTSEEQRLSNFLTWQSAYSELYFIKKHWPDFTKKDIDKAFKDYSKRHRRFGK